MKAESENGHAALSLLAVIMRSFKKVFKIFEMEPVVYLFRIAMFKGIFGSRAYTQKGSLEVTLFRMYFVCIAEFSNSNVATTS